MPNELTKPESEARNIGEVPWEKLTPDEKLERRCSAWLEAKDVQFVSPEAEEAYRGRVRRIIDAILLQKTPDRVPFLASDYGFAQTYYGYTHKDVMYDVDKAIEVASRFTLEFQPDTKIGLATHIGRIYEILEDKIYKWPGHGLPDDADGIQYQETDYMKEDEYEALMQDPSDYRLRTFLPRIWGAAEPLAKLGSLAQLNAGGLSQFGLPEVRAALDKLVQAGQVALVWQQKTAAANRQLTAQGFPSITGSSAGVPFAQFSDSLRGTRGIMMDMLRQPEKLLEAMNRQVPIIVKRCVAGAKLGASPIVDLHLHKGTDRVMSPKQFQTFYWEPVRRVIQGVVDEGLLVHMRLEGAFNSRLETMRDVPKGKTIFYLSWETELARAKEIVGDIACITSNVPSALVHSATPDEIAAYCRQAIEVGGKGGGFIFYTPMEGINRHSKPENVWALVKAAKECGVYK